MFCVRCYLENLTGESEFHIQDSQRLIVAPHLLPMRIFPEVAEMSDVTLTSGLHRYYPLAQRFTRNVLIFFFLGTWVY